MKRSQREEKRRRIRAFQAERHRWAKEHPEEALRKKEEQMLSRRMTVGTKAELERVRKERKRLKQAQRKERQPLMTKLQKLARWLRLDK